MNGPGIDELQLGQQIHMPKRSTWAGDLFVKNPHAGKEKHMHSAITRENHVRIVFLMEITFTIRDLSHPVSTEQCSLDFLFSKGYLTLFFVKFQYKFLCSRRTLNRLNKRSFVNHHIAFPPSFKNFLDDFWTFYKRNLTFFSEIPA